MQVNTFIYLQILSLWLRKFHIQSPYSIRRSKYTTGKCEKVQTTVAFLKGGPLLPRTIMSSRTCSGIIVPVPEPHALSGACLGTKGSLPQSRIFIPQRFD